MCQCYTPSSVKTLTWTNGLLLMISPMDLPSLHLLCTLENSISLEYNFKE